MSSSFVFFTVKGVFVDVSNGGIIDAVLGTDLVIHDVGIVAVLVLNVFIIDTVVVLWWSDGPR